MRLQRMSRPLTTTLPVKKPIRPIRIISILLTISLLTACGGGASKTATTANNPTSNNSVRAAFNEILEDIAGNENGKPVSYQQLNSITGLSGAIPGVNYATALAQGDFVNPAKPTQLEIQKVIDDANQVAHSNPGAGAGTGTGTTNHAPSISGNAPTQLDTRQTYDFRPVAQDADANDTLLFSIQNKPSWASFNQQTGQLGGTPTTAATYGNIIISVSDGKLSSSLPPFSIRVNLSAADEAEQNMENALVSGDASLLKVTDLLREARKEIALIKTGEHLLKTFYNNERIDYTPTNRTQIFTIKADLHKVFPIIQGNKGKILALAGTKNKSRFAAFGAAPMGFFQKNSNLSYEPQFKRVLAWLMAGEPLQLSVQNLSKKVAVSFVSADKRDIKDWLSSNYPNWAIKECSDIKTLATCYADADLVITGWQTDNSNAAQIKQVFSGLSQAGTPVLYLHTWYEATNDIAYTIAHTLGFDLKYGGNYWAKDSASWNTVEAMQAAVFNQLGYQSIDTVLAHFQKQDYHFDWSQCENSKGDKGENNDHCDKVPGLKTGVLDGLNTLRNITTQLDTDKIRLFGDLNDANDAYRIQKLLILLADKYRQTVHYPMDKVTTDDNAFMQSYFADHGLYHYRKINPVQSDMGNFSRSDFSHVTPLNKTVKLTSKRHFRSTGAYALPGKTVKVTRKDNSDLGVKVFINTQRSGATHQFQKQGYTRPKYLQTPHFEIKPGETIELTSAYGGTLQLEFSANDLPVEVFFENVGEHPYWASPADDVSFTQKLNAGDYDWAEVVTSGFEVHSTREKMRESVADPKWGSAQALANATKRYMSNFPHVLAGFKGPGIDVVDEIHDFATSNNLTIETLDIVKHMNADQATCGYGCSGNPYDAYWAYSPIGHGDLHELGHGLEKARFRFKGWEIHSTTNPYSYYAKSKYFETTGGDPVCQKLPFQSVFDKLQESANAADATAYLKTNLWKTSGWSQQFMVTLQAMMHAQKMGKLQNGWHLLARLHILERELKRAKKDWDNKKASVGFSNYSKTDIDAIDNNDWMLVSLSFAAGLDYRDYLNMMGIEYSQKAADQVASFNYPLVSKTYFASTPNGYCKSDAYGNMLDKTPVPIDGKSVWPVNGAGG